MKEISNYLILKNKQGTIKLQETKKCPNCDYEGLMVCWKTMGLDDIYCKCPDCKFTFGKQKIKD
jgi:ssDNA-binding Zn-finger/Zn-ribbon topoisomerase 1